MAIIRYELPSPMDAEKIWRLISEQMGGYLNDALIKKLVETFPKLAPRDIKMLVRLAFWVASKQGKSMNSLDLDLFRQCAMFRGVDVKSA